MDLISNSTGDGLAVASKGSATYVTLALLFSISTLMYFWLQNSGVKMDPREPPLIKPVIPKIGHALGYFLHQLKYLNHLIDKTDLPIFTLDMFSQKIYVIASPSLIQSALRNTKTLLFEPLAVKNSRVMFDLSESAMEVLQREPTTPGEPTYLNDIHQVMYKSLQPGPQLYKITARLLTTLTGMLNEIGTEEKPIKLFEWIKDSFTRASGDALYGPHNPFQLQPKLIEDLWNYDQDLLLLAAEFYPHLIAPKAHAGRRAIKAAFREYFERGHDAEASSFVQGRTRTARQHGLSADDLANFEISVPFVANTNSVPGGFWLLAHILAQPALRDEVRAEIAAVAVRETVVTNSTTTTTTTATNATNAATNAAAGGSSGGTDEEKVEEEEEEVVTLDISRFAAECPLLVAAWQESQRLANGQASIREVTEDTLLEGYLLRKGAIIQCPSGVTHVMKSVWGPDAESFDARRFLKQQQQQQPHGGSNSGEARRARTQAYFPFGGGKNLCPGRHFAFSEIAGLAATLVYGYDFRPVAEGAAMRVPESQAQKLGVGVRKPAGDMELLVSRRKGFEKVRWKFAFGGEVAGE